MDSLLLVGAGIWDRRVGNQPGQLQSYMLLENNGRASGSKRTRRINIRYFFVTDRVAAGDVKIQYCPTGVMIAHYFIKRLQGSAFGQFRDQILNIDGAPILIRAPLICAPSLNNGEDRRSVLDNKMMQTCTRKSRASLALDDVQSDGDDGPKRAIRLKKG
jgi:hypothetical protein